MSRVSPATSAPVPYLRLALAGFLYIAALPPLAHAITVGVQTTGGNPGDSVEVQVFLTGGNGLVAGMQTDIAWDSNCLSVAAGGGDAAACNANPAIPKTLTTRIRGTSNMRALFLSMSDVEPIKQDTWLFTCQFNIDAATTATQCPVNLVNLILSDPKGGRLPSTAVNGAVPINQPNAPNAAAQAPSGPAPALIVPGGTNVGGTTGAGAAAGAAAGGALGGAARSGAGILAPGLPTGQAPAAEEAAGAAPEAGNAAGRLTPSPARTLTAPATPAAPAGTPTLRAMTPTPKATAPQGTATPNGTPGTPTPKKE